ncbi:hypothetical protein [Streptomyces sp. NPDC058295]|jgi:hypothetical protein|uniref:hypothetical protein n=1 Tax=Streptomyces sp. NPDC058295 TaxID=3346431 RepID=UPI0036E59D97
MPAAIPDDLMEIIKAISRSDHVVIITALCSRAFTPEWLARHSVPWGPQSVSDRRESVER